MSRRGITPVASGIPLHCDVCPKRPSFSDVSHLLTHIGSKGHLSNYFTMKVKAPADPISKRVVDQYDQWYEEWNVQDLMSERYDQKEKKKSGAVSGNSSRRPSKVSSVASSRSTPVPLNWAGRRAQQLRENTLDPELGRAIKQEPISRSGTPVSGYAFDAAVYHRTYAPPMQTWPGAPYAVSPIQRDRSILNSRYGTPSSDSEATDVPIRAQSLGSKWNASTSNDSLALDDQEVDYDDANNDSVKLKGIIWPGMDLFDSATPDMRRKRNQKKSFSVVQSLQATSEVVEPTELVFDADGVLRRERPIIGNPEEDDGRGPLPGESSPEPADPPPKKKSGRRPRQALAEKHVNTGRALRNQRGIKPSTITSSRRIASYLDENDEDDALTYGGSRPRKRTRLDVHRDDAGPEINFEHPAPFDLLTSTFRNPLQVGAASAHLPYQNNAMSRGHRRQPSYSYGTRVAPNATNPFGLPPPDFGSFGQISGSSMFQQPSFQTMNPFQAVGSAMALPPQFNLNQQSFPHDNDFFQGAGWGGMPNHGSFDIFAGISQVDTGVDGNADATFQLGDGSGEFASMNPLFISSTHAMPDDENATVSPPSEHS